MLTTSAGLDAVTHIKMWVEVFIPRTLSQHVCRIRTQLGPDLYCRFAGAFGKLIVCNAFENGFADIEGCHGEVVAYAFCHDDSLCEAACGRMKKIVRDDSSLKAAVRTDFNLASFLPSHVWWSS